MPVDRQLPKKPPVQEAKVIVMNSRTGSGVSALDSQEAQAEILLLVQPLRSSNS